TNTEENLRAVLEANGVRLDDLTEGERAQVLDALAQQSGHPGAGNVARKERPSAVAAASSSSLAERNSNSSRETAVAQKQKESEIEIGALEGKGYPSAVAFDTGSGK